MPGACRYGVSQGLYEQFLRPLLLVGMFAPPEELSAAAMLGTFYFYSAPGLQCAMGRSACCWWGLSLPGALACESTTKMLCEVAAAPRQLTTSSPAHAAQDKPCFQTAGGTARLAVAAGQV